MQFTVNTHMMQADMNRQQITTGSRGDETEPWITGTVLIMRQNPTLTLNAQETNIILMQTDWIQASCQVIQ